VVLTLSGKLLCLVAVGASLVSGCGGNDAEISDAASSDVTADVETEEDGGRAEDSATGDMNSDDYSIPCDATPPESPGPGTFWATCEHNTDCRSGWCVETPEDARRCHQVCVDCCPVGFVCGPVPGPLDDQFLCFPSDDS